MTIAERKNVSGENEDKTVPVDTDELRPYAAMQREILAVIHAYGGELTDAQFDREFADFLHDEEIVDGRVVRVPKLNPRASHAWGHLMGTDALQQKYLMVLQNMISVSDGTVVDVRKGSDPVTYFIPEAPE